MKHKDIRPGVKALYDYSLVYSPKIVAITSYPTLVFSGYVCWLKGIDHYVPIESLESTKNAKDEIC
jgi:hypothetical protein